VHDIPKLRSVSKLFGEYLRQLVKHGIDFWSWSFYCKILPKILQLSPSCIFFCKWASRANIAWLLFPEFINSKANFLGNATSR